MGVHTSLTETDHPANKRTLRHRRIVKPPGIGLKPAGIELSPWHRIKPLWDTVEPPENGLNLRG
ncbi:hypothetical protein Hamer_G024323 [Homarus americanus]|uniref:Uncharacterized protein n=1 Tax=Homarus americanus TaxID=6706 RepID=A0A8J5MP30_HOMAM|nr:hypothetical protein Hamer_G024323 [Homarus americanus]